MAEQTSAAIRLPVAFIEDLSRAASIEAVLATAAAWLPDLNDADRAKLTFRDDTRLIARGARRDGMHDIDEDLAPIRPGDPRDRVLQSGLPLQMDAAALGRDPDPAIQALYDQGMRTALFVPMRTAGATVGIIGLQRRAATPFGDLQIRQLGAAGSWIAAQARLMQQLRSNARLAETDPLTGLANRARLMRVLDGPGALHQADGHGRIVGVLHVDLDRFKEINDRLGHATGDAVLTQAAEIMRQTAGPTDLVARVGGDEFVIATRTDRQGRHLARLAAALAGRLAAPMRVGGVDIRCPASIGTAMANSGASTGSNKGAGSGTSAGEAGTGAERLIANADLALYEVKRQGRGGVRAFATEMRDRFEARRSLHAELRAAVEEEAFEPHFQPIVTLADGALAGVAVLARWPHPDRGLLAPEGFLDAAAEVGLAARIDTIVRAKGLCALARLRAAGWTAPVMSVNISADTLSDPELPETLLWDVLGQGLQPADLRLDVAESLLIADAEGRVRDRIAALCAKGFAVEIDEFGTGHAAMPRMRQLQLRGLKLAPALTEHLPDTCAEAILGAILAMGAELGLSVTAKGVETAEELARLHALGCDRAQGRAVSAPLDEAALTDYLRRHGNPRLPLAAG
ncbi:EAL domain-containing protein [Psychromarinibacter sp. C21-152]|uniref:EAL domain-containing protein n=1 Tax=Psychromarinibacter sediminicola TaxID=3033385 RepID=A0AAE3NQW5_9RHOB|nr:EAL domain-containing protein [Psychromarinibacter sediminicola]MDF0600376.1 EAL domain-containing protein [Psychromarinibacter sediminicola]